MNRGWILAGAVMTCGVLVVARRPHASAPTSEAAAAELPLARCRTTRETPAVQTPGIAPICDDVYAETGLGAAQVDELKADVDVATRNVERFFGALRSGPLVFFCQSPACKIALGAAPSNAAYDDFGFASPDVTFADGAPVHSAVVVSGPFEGTARVLTHERVHAEMKSWISYDSLPTWFNEGTATYIANEPRCDPGIGAGLDVTPLSTKAAWERHLQKTDRVRETYCASRAKAGAWLERFESDEMRAEALRALMTSVKNGTPFETAFAAY